jgi:hypothetical protein
MASEAGPVAAYLAEVHRDLDAASLWGSFGAEDFDWQRHVPRLLAAVEAVLRLADQWHDRRGNDYSASALYASKLREVLEEELLSEGGARG